MCRQIVIEHSKVMNYEIPVPETSSCSEEASAQSLHTCVQAQAEPDIFINEPMNTSVREAGVETVNIDVQPCETGQKQHVRSKTRRNLISQQ